MREDKSKEDLKTDLAELKGKFGEIEDKVEDGMEDARSFFRDRAKVLKRNAQDKVAQKPVKSLGAAFGGGLVAGMVTYAVLRGKFSAK